MTVLNNESIGEAVAIIDRMADLFLTATRGKIGRPGSDVRRSVGDLRADAEQLIQTAGAGARIAEAFEFVRTAGATLYDLEAIRVAIYLEAPEYTLGRIIAQASLGFCLITQSRIVAGMEFRSRQQVDEILALMHAAFEPSETYAADQYQSSAYRGLIGLHAKVTRHLVNRARPLPSMVDYAFPNWTPVLTLANRLYGDADRESELRAENNVVHPLFMPRTGKALAR